MKKLRIAGAVFVALTSMSAQADVTLFSDDFESGLVKWNPLGTAVLVADPADPLSGNHVLRFNGLGSGGDIYSANSFFAPSQIYTITFDYFSAGKKGLPTNDLGGFVGIGDGKPGNHTWIAGTQASYPGIKQQLVHNGTWTTYSITVDANTETFYYGNVALKGKPLYIFLEDFVGSDQIAGNVYFDNIAVTAVPESETYAMMLAGLGVMGFIARRRKTGQA
jgi:hypothetical protein